MPVDETRPILYLHMTMTRRFLALLALLTGLVAFGGTAQASLAEALACNTSIAASAGDAAQGADNAALQPVPATVQESREVEKPRRRAAPPSGLRLPVLMGVERAFE